VSSNPDEWLPFTDKVDASATMEGLVSRLVPPLLSVVNTPAFTDRSGHLWWANGPAYVWPDGRITVIWMIG
jgi:hypothetical protein